MLLNRRTDAGFTLIEMIVAMILFTVAIAAILPAIINTRDATTRQAALSQADGDVKIAAKLFEQDVRSARGMRGTGDRNGASGAGTASTVGSLSMPLGPAHDVIVATPTQFSIFADVLPEPAATPVIERVDWRLVTDSPVCGTRLQPGNTNWCLTRSVQSATGTTSEVVVASRGTVPASTSCFPPGTPTSPQQRMFCYEISEPVGGYNYSAGWTSRCRASWFAPGSLDAMPATVIATRHNAVDTGTSINQLDRITTVGAALQSGGAYGLATERSYEGTQVSLRSRESPAYREAIMCGSRIGWIR